MGYDLYPAVDETYNFPPEIRRALAASNELRSLVIPMTTTIRNNLLPAELWDGRVIANTTTDRLERYDAGTTTWYSISEATDLTALQASSKQYVDTTRVGKNRVMNGNLIMNARAITGPTNIVGQTVYTFDRWAATANYATASTTRVLTASNELPESASQYMRISCSAQTDPASYVQIIHKLEGVRTVSGKTMTMSFWAKADVAGLKVAFQVHQNFGTGGGASAGVSTYTPPITLTTAWARYSITVNVPSIAGKTVGTSITDCVELHFWVSAGTTHQPNLGGLGLQAGNFDFWGFQFEEGPVATALEYLQFSDTIVQCQRYFQRKAVGLPGFFASATIFRTYYTYGINMRAAPQATLISPGIVNWLSGNPIPTSMATTPRSTFCSFDLDLSGGSAGAPGVWYDGVFDLNAEL